MRYCHCSSSPPSSPSFPSSGQSDQTDQQRGADKRGNLIFLCFCFRISKIALTTAIKKSEAQLNAFNGLNLYERPRQRCISRISLNWRQNWDIFFAVEHALKPKTIQNTFYFLLIHFWDILLFSKCSFWRTMSSPQYSDRQDFYLMVVFGPNSKCCGNMAANCVWQKVDESQTELVFWRGCTLFI